MSAGSAGRPRLHSFEIFSAAWLIPSQWHRRLHVESYAVLHGCLYVFGLKWVPRLVNRRPILKHVVQQLRADAIERT